MTVAASERTELRTSADTLSETTRLLTRLQALPLGAIGLVLFLAPEWASSHFLWNVPPFAMMTFGGWYLGGAIAALEIARVWRWAAVYPGQLLLWTFSVGNLTVVLAHADKLDMGKALAWPYLAAIGFAAAVALYGMWDWLRRRPMRASGGRRVPLAIRIIAVVFALEAMAITLLALLGKYGDKGDVFPEPLTVFTLNALGVFYLAIAVAVVPLAWERWLMPVLFFARVGLAFVIPITVATIVYLDLFDFGEHPVSASYPATYALLMLVAGAYVIRYWQYSRETERSR